MSVIVSYCILVLERIVSMDSFDGQNESQNTRIWPL